MEKILNQDEIDALFQSSHGSKSERDKDRPTRRVTRCDFRQAGQINKDQVRAVSTLHDTFAANITNSLAAYLRVAFEVNLVSVEQLKYAEFLGRMPELTYLASLGIQPLESSGLMQMDLSLAFPIIDLVLGGLGKGGIEDRGITDIEEQILESVVRVIIRELEATWQTVLEVGFSFDHRQLAAQVFSLMSPTEKVLSLSFEIRMPEARGMLNVAFPAVVSNALLRKLSAQWVGPRPTGSSSSREQIRHRLLDCRLPVELNLPTTMIPIRQLLRLENGDVITLKQRVGAPACLSVSTKDMYLAFPVSCGTQRGARVQQTLSLVDKQPKEAK